MSRIDYAALKAQPWFIDGSRHDAESVLRDEEAGSFVIRPSSQPNCLALSHKVSNGSIGHALIHDTPQGYRLEQTQNAFPSLELLVLSIKKHFTVNDSMSSFGQAQAAPAANGKRLSANNQKIAEMSEMFSAHPRESMVAALQLANGDTEKATELMLSEELYTNNQDDEQNQALSEMIASSLQELAPKIVALRDAVHAISTFQELKAKVSLGKAIADIKRALAPFPATSKRPKPAELPAGKPGTTQAQLIRFKNTIAISVWEILRKLDGIGARVQSSQLGADRLQQIATAVRSMRETLESVQTPVPARSPVAPRRGPKSDEEFYIDIAEIHKESEIGKGAYGKVYKGRFRGRTVTIKTIEVKDDKELVLIRREISLLRECDHPNIVELIGVSKEGDALLLVTELCDRGELYKVLLDESIEIDWPLRLKIAQDVASGLAHVHSKNLIHRDIKSENLLVNSNWEVKLCAFGFFLCELITRGAINLVRRKETAFGLDVKALEEHIPKDCPPLFWKVAFCSCTYQSNRRPTMSQIEKMLMKIRVKYPITKKYTL